MPLASLTKPTEVPSARACRCLDPRPGPRCPFCSSGHACLCVCTCVCLCACGQPRSLCQRFVLLRVWNLLNFRGMCFFYHYEGCFREYLSTDVTVWNVAAHWLPPASSPPRSRNALARSSYCVPPGHAILSVPSYLHLCLSAAAEAPVCNARPCRSLTGALGTPCPGLAACSVAWPCDQTSRLVLLDVRASRVGAVERENREFVAQHTCACALGSSPGVKWLSR